MANPIHSFAAALLMSIAVLALSACGFHLRGTGGMALNLPATYLDTGSVSAVLDQSVRAALRDAGVTLVEQRAAAQTVLLISQEDQSRRVLSVATTGKVNEYELQYGFVFALSDADGKARLAAQHVSGVRDYSFSDAQVLAKDTEEAILLQDLRRDTVQTMLRRLRATPHDASSGHR